MSSTALPFIVLVEDSDDDAFFFKRALRQSGFACETKHFIDGGQAAAYLEKVAARDPAARRPDLVFLDLKIPTLNGFEVLERVRSQSFQPPLDIAVLSGSEHGGDVERAMGLGATAYYVKPILVQQLKARFDAWQRTHAATQPPALAPGQNGPA